MKDILKTCTLFFSCLVGVILCASCGHKQTRRVVTSKPALMWFDAEANFGRFNQKDSIDFYLEKIKSLGFTHAVVDVRPITGEVLFESAYAPKMEEWNGAKAGDFD
ncbi:S-layer protein, partial [Bacteroides uniformis]